jgi:hypothetical protein
MELQIIFDTLKYKYKTASLMRQDKGRPCAQGLNEAQGPSLFKKGQGPIIMTHYGLLI